MTHISSRIVRSFATYRVKVDGRELSGNDALHHSATSPAFRRRVGGRQGIGTGARGSARARPFAQRLARSGH
jgi:hypothetical protein